MSDETPPIWDSVCRALDVELRPETEIVGDSGMMHQVQAVGVDDNTRRVIIFSAEYNPRIAALMRVDVQATLPDTRVIVARPLAIDLAHSARTIFFGSDGRLDLGKVMKLGEILKLGEKAQPALEEEYGPDFKAILRGMSRSNLPVRSHMLNIIEQASNLDWTGLKDGGLAGAMGVTINVINQFSSSDNLAGDRAQGICPLPTYEMTEKDWELFSSGTRIDEVQSRLRALNVYQYFFPPSDSLALGLIENNITDPRAITEGFEVATKAGHILSSNELVNQVRDIPELIEAIAESGYVAQGEQEITITEQGKSFRQMVKFSPRESIFTRILNRISLSASVSPKDFMGP